MEYKKAKALRAKFNALMIEELKKTNPELPDLARSSMYKPHGGGNDKDGEMLRRYERLKSFKDKKVRFFIIFNSWDSA